MLDEAGFPDAVISASNDLDEYLIDSLKAQGCKVTSWGVGTHMITSKNWPSFGGVYKLAAIMDENGNFIPKIKLSENSEKITNPGNKVIHRIYEKESGKIKADLIALEDEVFDENEPLLLFDPLEPWKKTLLEPGTYTMRELMVPVFLDGKCVYTSPSVMEIREYCQKELDTLWMKRDVLSTLTRYMWIFPPSCIISKSSCWIRWDRFTDQYKNNKETLCLK